MYWSVVSLQLEVPRLWHGPVHPFQNPHGNNWKPEYKHTEHEDRSEKSGLTNLHYFWIQLKSVHKDKYQVKEKHLGDNHKKSLSHSPDAPVQSAEFSHQLRGSFVLIAAQVVHRLYGLRGRLQLIFIDVDSLILVLNKKKKLKVILMTFL